MRYFLPLFALLASCAHQPASRAKVALPSKIVDAHAHFDAAPLQPSEKMQVAYGDSNIVAAVVHAPRDGKDSAKLNPNSSIHFAVCGAVVENATAKTIEQGIRNGRYKCMKVYLGYVRKWATDPFYAPFYKLAEKYRVPVVFHTGDTFDKDGHVKYADPLTIDEIAVKYRKVNFVLAHMGNPWLQSAAEVVYKNDNVYADTSALMLDDVSKQSPETVEELIVKPMKWFLHYVENPKKILFGTDWPLLSVRPYAEAVARAIPEKDREDVFYNNAARLFKFESVEAPTPKRLFSSSKKGKKFRAR